MARQDDPGISGGVLPVVIRGHFHEWVPDVFDGRLFTRFDVLLFSGNGNPQRSLVALFCRHVRSERVNPYIVHRHYRGSPQYGRLFPRGRHVDVGRE